MDDGYEMSRKAGRAAGLEEAAKMLEARELDLRRRGFPNIVYIELTEQAAAIRALIPQK